MPRHLVIAAFLFAGLVLASAALLATLAGHGAQRPVPDAELARQEDPARQYVSNNLQLMAARLGELQAQVLQLDGLGERLAGLAGIKREAAPAPERPGQGGAFVPAPMTAGQLRGEIERLAQVIDARSDYLGELESRFLEQRVRERLLPTTLPVKGAYLGSPFGPRNDPIAGLRALHEGIDFNAERGTPVVAAADGVVVTAAWQGDFGNMVEIDHGEGLTTRYAHLSNIDVQPGRLVKREQRIGAVGNTGRSTGPHLHFEVRMLGAPQNPALFLKQGEEYAQLRPR